MIMHHPRLKASTSTLHNRTNYAAISSMKELCFSKFSMKRIAVWTKCPTPLPLSKDGVILNWNRVRGNYAPPMTSAYGPRHFFLGGSTKKFVLDFFGLPDSRVVIRVSAEPKLLLGVHPENRQNIHLLEEVEQAAFHITENLLDSLPHDTDHFGFDQWHFLRAICLFTGTHRKRAKAQSPSPPRSFDGVDVIGRSSSPLTNL